MDDLAVRLADEHDLATAYTDALDRFLVLGGEDFDARVRVSARTTSGWAARSGPVRCIFPFRRRGRTGGARCDPALPLRRVPSGRTDQQPRLRRPRDGSSAFSAGWSAGVVLVSHDRDFPRPDDQSRGWRSKPRRAASTSTAGTWSEYQAARARARAQHEARHADYVDEKRPVHDAARGPAPPGAHTGRRAQAGAPDGRRRPTGDERPARQGQSGPATTLSGSKRSRSRGRRGGC